MGRWHGWVATNGRASWSMGWTRRRSHLDHTSRREQGSGCPQPSLIGTPVSWSLWPVDAHVSAGLGVDRMTALESGTQKMMYHSRSLGVPSALTVLSLESLGAVFD